MDFDKFARNVSAALDQRISRRTMTAATGASAAAIALRSPIAAQEGSPEADSHPESPEFLFVQTFANGTLVPSGQEDSEINVTVTGTPTTIDAPAFTLTISGHLGNTIYFSDRPARIFGSGPTERFLDGLGFTPVDPPNAALVTESDAGEPITVIVELFDPVYDESTDTITYNANILAGYEGDGLDHVTDDALSSDVPASFGPGSLFIDDCSDRLFWCVTPDQQRHGPIQVGMCWSWTALNCDPCQNPDELCKERMFECKDGCTAQRVYS